MTPALTVAYDPNGNTLSDPQGPTYTWDFENRLTQVVNPGVGTTTFRYDPFGAASRSPARGIFWILRCGAKYPIF